MMILMMTSLLLVVDQQTNQLAVVDFGYVVRQFAKTSVDIRSIDGTRLEETRKKIPIGNLNRTKSSPQW